MSTLASATRLHHTAYLSKDLEATRAFYEDLVGIPLVATWSETDELFGAERVYCHCFFGMPDGSALAFFQFANKEDQDLFDPDLTPSPFRHIALNVGAEAQDAIFARLQKPIGSQKEPTYLSMAIAVRSIQKIQTACCWSSPPMLQVQTKSMRLARTMLMQH